MPHLMNCSHSDTGWCLECVKELWGNAASHEFRGDSDHLDAYPEGNYVVVAGTGVKLWGPYTTMRAAVEWVEKRQPFIGPVTIMPVESPENFPWKEVQCTTTDSDSVAE